MEQEQAPCPGCGEPVSFDPCYRVGNETRAPYCSECEAQQLRDYNRQAAENAIVRHWEKLCPARYQDTEFGKLPCPDKSTRALEWSFDRGHGLNLWGNPDTGKTRTMFLILEREHRKGQTISVFSPTDFCAALEQRGFAWASWAKRVARRDLVAFDDMDKLSLSRAQENTFFGILDKRMASRLPCIFTHNSNSEELTYRFKNGEALVKRIRNYTMSLHFP